MENVETLGATRPSRLILKAFLEKHIKGRALFTSLYSQKCFYSITYYIVVSYVILLDVFPSF